MDIQQEINIAMGAIFVTIEEQGLPYIELEMNCNKDDTLNDVINFSEGLRINGYMTSFRIVRDQEGNPCVYAKIEKTEENKE